MKESHGDYAGKSRNFKSKGKLPISVFLKEFKSGEKVRITANPSFKKGSVNKLRFNNRIGTIVGKQGKCYKIKFNDGGKEKTLFVSNVHLTEVK